MVECKVVVMDGGWMIVGEYNAWTMERNIYVSGCIGTTSGNTPTRCSSDGLSDVTTDRAVDLSTHGEKSE